MEKQTRVYATEEERGDVLDYCAKVKRETGKFLSVSNFYVEAGKEKIERERKRENHERN